MSQTILSTNNSLIKETAKLKQKKFRRELNSAIIEGHKIITEAIEVGVTFKYLFMLESKKEEYKHFLHKLNCEVIYINERVLKQITVTNSPQGILAVIDISKLSPITINGNFLILDHIQDPGNLGAIVRSAVATGFTNIYMINCVDLYNEKVVRASMGNLFKINAHSVSFEQLKKLVTSLNAEVLASDLNGENIFEINLPTETQIGIIIGNEGSGISKSVKALATKTVTIPMKNNVESLNAAVSASIVMYKFIN